MRYRMSYLWTSVLGGRRRRRRLWPALVLLAALLSAPLLPGLAAPAAQEGQPPAAAQSCCCTQRDATTLGAGTISVSPASATILIGQTVDIYVRIDDVTDLYGMNFVLFYDTSIASVPANRGTLLWEVLDEDYHFTVANTVGSTPPWPPPYGTCESATNRRFYEYAVSNVAPASPFSGSGNFVRLTFRGESAGTTALSFCYAKGSTRDGGALWPATVGGSITVADGRIGDRVWNDLDRDGLQDGDEPGKSGVTVNLLSGSGNFLRSTVTGSNGFYQFTGLSAGTYIVEFVQPSGHYFTVYNADGQGLTGPNNSDANRTTGRTVSFSVSSPTPISYVDAGLVELPTAAAVHDLQAYVHDGHVVVQWQTSAEWGTLGFDLLRLDEASGEYVQVNQRLLPAVGAPQGGIYRFVDPSAVPGARYVYQLVEMEPEGPGRVHGPFALQPQGAGPPVAEGYAASARAVTHVQSARLVERKAAQQQAALTRAARGWEAGAGDQPDLLLRDEMALKIVIRQSGLYELTAAQIAAASGVSPKLVRIWLKSRRVQLQNGGQDVAYRVADDASSLYFYGQAVDSLYTDDNVYWLRLDEGLRMEQVKGKRAEPASPTQFFFDTLHLEQDRLPAPALFHDPQADYCLWTEVWSGFPAKDRQAFAFRVDGLAPGEAELALRLHGYFNSPVSPDHHVVVSLNGQQVGEGRWDGAVPFDLVLRVPPTLLQDGENILQVQGVLDAGVPYSAFGVDSFDITYPRYYRAVNDALLFRGAGNTVVTVFDFSRPTIWVWDVTDALRPKEVASTRVQQVGRDRYAVTFAPESPDALYLAITPQVALAPQAVFADAPSRLRRPNNAADYVVITPLELREAAQALADYRRTQGLKTMVVELEDIYDEFNHGLASPVALRAFLSYAYHNWRQAPTYVLLAGEGTYDYKDRLGHGDNLLPVWMVGTDRGLLPADNRFADVSGEDGVPEMAIGRLPAMTPAELYAAVAKIRAYESASGQGWANQAILLSDDADAGGDFCSDSRAVAALLTPAYTTNLIALGEMPLSSARDSLFTAWNRGAGLFNYIGHAGLDRLASEGLLLTDDVPALRNGLRLPVAVLMTCASGQFAMPGFDSLAEALLASPDGGAIAVWAPSGWSLNDPAAHLDASFCRALVGAPNRVLGLAVRAALQEYASLDTPPFMLDIYNLLGDPALRVK